MVDQRFEQYRGAGFVDRRVALDRIHRLTDADFRSEMDDAIDALQRTRHDVPVADIADDEFCVIRKIIGPLAITVDLLNQAI